jgi:excinuclease ABC subunit C
VGVEQILSAFFVQHYAQLALSLQPTEILFSETLKNHDQIMSLLGSILEAPVTLTSAKNNIKKRWLAMAKQSAQDALNARLKPNVFIETGFLELKEYLHLNETLQKIVCFDISHMQGKSTVGGCVVFTPKGPKKIEYKHFNIRTAKPGDDCGAMKEALTRYFTKLKMQETILPDLLLVDGGRAQLKITERVLESLQIDTIEILGIAKGENRKLGQETFFKNSKGTLFILPDHGNAKRLLMHIRDNAHRFALTGHQAKRSKAIFQSSLELIPGIGKKRRLNLLKWFGGGRRIKAS